MDHFEHPNPRVHKHKQLLSHNSKRIIIKFLLPLSLFCALISLLPFLLHSSKPFLNQLFNTDKSYMFLLCNGLLVFVAKNSGLINNGSSTPSTHHQSIELEVDVDVDHEESDRLEEFTVPGTPATIASENENDLEIEYQQAEQNSLMIVALEQGHEEEGNASAEDIDEEDLHEHASEDTEELNKKCEDFIRKMRAAFCSEPIADHSFYFDNQK